MYSHSIAFFPYSISSFKFLFNQCRFFLLVKSFLLMKRCPEAHLFHINASNLDSPFHIILKDRESSQSVPNNICCFDLERMWNYRRTKELIYPKGLPLVLLVLLQTVSQKEFFPAVTTLLCSIHGSHSYTRSLPEASFTYFWLCFSTT